MSARIHADVAALAQHLDRRLDELNPAGVVLPTQEWLEEYISANPTEAPAPVTVTACLLCARPDSAVDIPGAVPCCARCASVLGADSVVAKLQRIATGEAATLTLTRMLAELDHLAEDPP